MINNINIIILTFNTGFLSLLIMLSVICKYLVNLGYFLVNLGYFSIDFKLSSIYPVSKIRPILIKIVNIEKDISILIRATI